MFVPDEAPIDIGIGERSERLDALVHAYGCEHWAYITAWNPGSQPLAPEANDARQVALINALQQRGLPWLDGSGIPADALWQPEASVLVLGMGRDEAAGLGKRFGQAAVVVGSRGGIAELIYCNNPPAP